MTSCPPTDRFLREARRLDLCPSPTVLDGLQYHLEQVYETNRSFNLTAIRDPEEAWIRHVLDSLALLPFLPEEGRAMDIGSGAGFPGMVLALARPDLEWVLVDSTGKKASFLAECAASLELDPQRFRVVHGRAEELCHDLQWRHGAAVVTARGVGALRGLMEYTLPLVEPGGTLLAMKGSRAAEEIRDAEHACTQLDAELEMHPVLEGVEGEACVVVARPTQIISEHYPRAFGLIRKSPL